jgi:hypothetical protein
MSRITIPVPHGIRVQAGGFGADTGPGAVLAADAPVLHVRGFTCKVTDEVRSRPPED